MAKKTEKKIQTVKFHYQKTNSYRNHHVDGAFGGITPKALVNMMFYTERSVLPKIVEQEVDENGKLGKNINVEQKDGIIRDIETSITFDINTAISIRDWLTTIIDSHPINKGK